MGWFWQGDDVRKSAMVAQADAKAAQEKSAEPKMSAKEMLLALKTKKAAQACALLVACERRLVDDPSLLEWCDEFLTERERFTGWSFVPNVPRESYDAVAAARNVVALRVAEASVVQAKEKVKQAKAAVAGA